MNAFKKRLLTRLAILGGGIILLVLFIILLNVDINKRMAAIEESKALLASRDEAVSLLTHSQLDLERVENGISVLGRVLPNKDELINFPRELEGMANKYLLDIGFSFGVESAGVESRPNSISFTMTLSGAYEDITDFLEELEEHRYIILIDSAEVRRGNDGRYSFLTGGSIYTRAESNEG